MLGLISNIECKFVKTDPALIDSLAEARKITPELVKKCTRYNVFTVQQFSTLTGLDVSTIHNLTRPSVIGEEVGTKLNYCYPFPDNDGRGPKFIIRDEKSEKYLKA